MLSNKIKSLLTAHGLGYNDLATALGVSAQAVYNRANRNSFTALELVTVASLCNAVLSFQLSDGSQVVINTDDLT